jgi:pyrimidine-nucleoside phosphorylase
MRHVDVIAKKRDGHRLSRAEIDLFISGVTDGTMPDYQVAALLMAIVLRGMAAEETAWLTEAMVRSGDRVDLSDIPGTKVGKHSTGGVGDKVSIVLAPIATRVARSTSSSRSPGSASTCQLPSSNRYSARSERASSDKRPPSRRRTRSCTRCAMSRAQSRAFR